MADDKPPRLEGELLRRLALHWLIKEAAHRDRMRMLATMTEYRESYAPDTTRCPDCYDGGACLPGGCGIEGCTRCGKMCPTCNGTCEVKVKR